MLGRTHNRLQLVQSTYTGEKPNKHTAVHSPKIKYGFKNYTDLKEYNNEDGDGDFDQNSSVVYDIKYPNTCSLKFYQVLVKAC